MQESSGMSNRDAVKGKARYALRMIPEPAVVLDREFRILGVNGPFLREFALTRRNLAGRHLLELPQLSWDREVLEDNLNRLLAGGRTFLAFEVGAFLGRTKDKRTLSVHMRRVVGADPAEDMLVMSFTDVTPHRSLRRNLESRHAQVCEELLDKRKKLEDKDKMLKEQASLADLGMMVSMASHELRKPLSVIGMALANLEKKNTDPALGQHIEKIKNNLKRGDRIIDSMLNYSRIKDPELETFPVDKLVVEIWEDVFSQDRPGIDGRLDIEGIRGVEARADIVQIRHVIENLLYNAIEAVAGKGAVELVAYMDGNGEIVLEVRDTTPAIPEELRERIFEPFFTTKKDSSGLGLSICRQMLRLHGGSISYGTAEGGGNVFTVRLPSEGPFSGTDPEKSQ